MGRTQTSTTVLHSIFREKTSRALDNVSKIIVLFTSNASCMLKHLEHWSFRVYVHFIAFLDFVLFDLK